MAMDSRASVERTARNLVAQVERITAGMEQRDREANERFQEFYRVVLIQRDRALDTLAEAQRVLADIRAERAAIEATKATMEATIVDGLATMARVLEQMRGEHATFTIEMAAFNEQAAQVAALIQAFADTLRRLQQPPNPPPEPPAAPPGA